MISKDLLKNIISDSQTQIIPETWERTMKVPIDSGKIITLIGVRRSGKTYHLFHIMNKLKKAGVAPEQVLYINFEDERLDIKSSDLDVILQAYRELYPELDLTKCYFFFDEIQEVEGWEKFIERLYSSVSRNVFVTGSNAKLLSQEIASALRGRPITFEVYPLSFHEFVDVLNPDLTPHNSVNRAKIINLFERFMMQGGFPEVITQDQSLKNKILQEYFNAMLFKDLVDRYKITQVAVLKYFCKKIVGTSAGEFSVNKIYNELKSQGYGISKDTLYEFQNYVEAIYLNRFIAKHAYSVVKSEGSQKKTYVIDQGLGAALDYKLSRDRGRLLENTVALELLKQGKQIMYQQGNGECDFVINEKDTITEAIQVSIDLTNELTRKREINGLTQCCKVLGLGKGIIITFDLEEQFENNGIQIVVVPAWKYFWSNKVF